MARPSYDADSLLLGVIGRPHGLAGEMTLRPHNGHSTNLAGVPVLILERGTGREEHRVTSARRGVDGWLIQLAGIDSRAAAAALTHATVRAKKEFLPPLGPGEFFIEDLLGCAVRDESGQVLGHVGSVFWNGAHDVMSVGAGDGPTGAGARASAEGDLLIPVVPAFIRAVDVAARQVVVAWEGHD